MPFAKFSNLDFDQIRTQIKDYLRANSNFTDFDFEGSNFSVLIDTLAYNTYISAFNSNLVVNESFLDSATLRENVVSLARNIGYVPRSKTAARASIIFQVQTGSSSPTLTLQPGLVCTGAQDDTSFVFSISEQVTTVVNNGIAQFGTTEDPLKVLEGTFLTSQFIVDGSLEQRFILENGSIDSSSIVVYVKGAADPGLGNQYKEVDNIVNVNSSSETYLIQEIQDEKYELLFGDGIFGKKLENGAVITVQYIVTSGVEGNGPSIFSYAGSLEDSLGNVVVPTVVPTITTINAASNGGEIEPLDSIKYFAPRLYSAQYRAVTARDYETIVQSIYPNTESVSVVGGEELSPPEFGTVFITIKPKNGEFVSDFDKNNILTKLKSYSLTGINQKIVDLQVLYVEVDSFIYYNSSQVANVNDLKSKIITSLTSYAKSSDLNRFGGRFKYSKVLNVVDNIDKAITSNITRVRIRRNLNALVNQFAQYELCFGNRFYINPAGFNIKSTGFTVTGTSVIAYLTDIPNKDAAGNLDGSMKGTLSVVSKNNQNQQVVLIKDAGGVDYKKGEIILNTINFASTQSQNNIIEIQAYPESNDVVGLKDLFVSFDVSNSSINMVKDVIASGEDVSGVVFTRDYFTSSYSNGVLERK